MNSIQLGGVAGEDGIDIFPYSVVLVHKEG